MNLCRFLHACCAIAAAFALQTPLQANAQVDEAHARQVAVELGLLVNEATAAIGAVQNDINAGTGGDKVKPDALQAAFAARYAKAAGKPFDTKGDGLIGDTRRAFSSSLNDTLTRFQPQMSKGGQDAFVPAFFRAELLKRMNVQLKGKVQGYATNRDKELINADWSVDKVMKGSPLAPDVARMVNAGDSAHSVKRSGDRLMAYWPMKLGTACVACHARNGLAQKEGEFGGALVAEVWVK
ncbi:MAG: hypothetical protein LW854_23170 [Rubrivivax sp.]|jgi:hypothetical protein|nr:hypothetical protein [Rubrivivax sp.]